MALTKEERELLEQEADSETTFGDGEGISSSEIDFYGYESDVEGNKQRLQRLREENAGIDEELTAIDLHSGFTSHPPDEVNWKIGRTLYEMALGELERFAGRQLPPEEEQKLDLIGVARNLDYDEYDRFDVLADYFTDEGIDPERFREEFGWAPDSMPEVTNSFMKEYMPEYLSDFGEEFWTVPQRLTKAFALDTVKSMQKYAFNREDPESYTDKVNEYELFFSRLSPAMSGRMEPRTKYEVVPVENRESIKCLGLEVPGSCLLSGHEQYGFEDDEEMFRNHPLEPGFGMWYRDPGTIYHAIGKDGELAGYIRAFLLEDSNGDMFAGVDTIEVPKSGGLDIEDVDDDFWEQSDVISAGVYGAIPYYFMMGAEYVAGKDARVKYGPRQAFGNTRKPIEYRKIGDTVPYYSTYKGEDWEGAGWLNFNDPEEADIRGFRTEPGWHQTNNAYILMENPGNLPE